MTNNDILRSVRYMLDLNDAKMVAIFALAECEVPQADITSWLKKDEDAAFRPCPDVLMGYFLNGLIFHRRGKSEDAPAPSIERKMNNNIFMKKLRIAFDLKTTDIPDILKKPTSPCLRQRLARSSVNRITKTIVNAVTRFCAISSRG